MASTIEHDGRRYAVHVASEDGAFARELVILLRARSAPSDARSARSSMQRSPTFWAVVFGVWSAGIFSGAALERLTRDDSNEPTRTVSRDERGTSRDPSSNRAEPRVSATHDGRFAESDDSGDARMDRAVVIGGHGLPTAIWFDTDRDGVYDRFQRIDRETGVVEELRDEDGDGFPEAHRTRSPAADVWREPPWIEHVAEEGSFEPAGPPSDGSRLANEPARAPTQGVP
ncbi:MAG: hypothetical protein MUE69_25620 [Myxococcota bacterium]|nr:hypothetical protein [Myxococcota bacterium]